MNLLKTTAVTAIAAGLAGGMATAHAADYATVVSSTPIVQAVPAARQECVDVAAPGRTAAVGRRRADRRDRRRRRRQPVRARHGPRCRDRSRRDRRLRAGQPCRDEQPPGRRRVVAAVPHRPGAREARRRLRRGLRVQRPALQHPPRPRPGPASGHRRAPGRRSQQPPSHRHGGPAGATSDAPAYVEQPRYVEPPRYQEAPRYVEPATIGYYEQAPQVYAPAPVYYDSPAALRRAGGHRPGHRLLDGPQLARRPPPPQPSPRPARPPLSRSSRKRKGPRRGPFLCARAASDRRQAAALATTRAISSTLFE